jgi:hypothetical protein
LTGLLVEGRRARADLRPGSLGEGRRPPPISRRSRRHGRCCQASFARAGPGPLDRIEIVANTLSDPADMKAMIRSLELCREIGNSAGISPFVKREVMPGSLARNAL